MATENQVDDLSDVIEGLATGTYVVKRYGPTTFTAGRRVVPSSTTFEISAVVYPAGSRELQRLPEGLRHHETLSIVTKTELKISSPSQEPDVVTVAGDDFQVQAVDRWQPSGNFFRALATRVSSR